jgi:hypothetical protein
VSVAYDPRKSELAKIHVGKAKLALEGDSYRAIVKRISGGRTETAKDLTEAERHALLDHFAELGFKPQAKPSGFARHADPRPQARKLKALWWALWMLGEVRDPSDGAMVSYVQSTTGIAVLRWNSTADLHRAIDCLKAWCKRIGYEAKPFHATLETPGEGQYEPVLIEAQWDRIKKLGATKAGIHADLGAWLDREGFHVAAPQFLDREDAQEVVKRLGKWLRRVTRGHPQEDADG